MENGHLVTRIISLKRNLMPTHCRSCYIEYFMSFLILVRGFTRRQVWNLVCVNLMEAYE